MSNGMRLATALAVSLIASAAAQCALLVSLGDAAALEHWLELFLPLAGMVAVVTALFAAVIGRSPRYADVLTLFLIAAILIGGYALHVAGENSRSPGVGGTVFAGLVGIVISYYLPPGALAVAIHWLMLRGR